MNETIFYLSASEVLFSGTDIVKRPDAADVYTFSNGKSNGKTNGKTSPQLAQRQIEIVLDEIRAIADPILGEVLLQKMTTILVRTFGRTIGEAIESLAGPENDVEASALLSALGGVDDEASADWRRTILEEYRNSPSAVIVAGAEDGLDLLDEWNARRKRSPAVHDPASA